MSLRGHRFLGRPEIRVHNFADYEKKLRANGVIVRPAERLENITRSWQATPSAAATTFMKMRTCCNWSAT